LANVRTEYLWIESQNRKKFVAHCALASAFVAGRQDYESLGSKLRHSMLGI